MTGCQTPSQKCLPKFSTCSNKMYTNTKKKIMEKRAHKRSKRLNKNQNGREKHKKLKEKHQEVNIQNAIVDKNEYKPIWPSCHHPGLETRFSVWSAEYVKILSTLVGHLYFEIWSLAIFPLLLSKITQKKASDQLSFLTLIIHHSCGSQGQAGSHMATFYIQHSNCGNDSWSALSHHTPSINTCWSTLTVHSFWIIPHKPWNISLANLWG